MTNSRLEILYQDEALIAVDKPAGLLCHRSRIDKFATEFAVQKLRDQIGSDVFLIHRIDRPTSGVLLFALNSATARNLSQQMASHEIIKEYRAIVRGHPPQHGRWEEALLEKPDRKTDREAQKDKPPQAAITEFATQTYWEIPFSAGKYPTSRYSEVLVKPLTGRRHQIRRHFNHMAYPLIGDTSHGDRRHNRLFREELGVSGLLLVACLVKFRHPVSGDWVQVSANPNVAFKEARRQLWLHDIASPRVTH
ncbi:MAG: pseudouridine synthase [Pirellulaceae bacterium]|nr:pseudouridine synthase [Pirellulaceae bacterium]